MSRSVRQAGGRHQAGASLIIVIILLLVVTLLGLAALRSTLLRERMSANIYDRSLAFQAAESALREAEVVVRSALVAGGSYGFDCTASGQACPSVPSNAYTGNASGCTPGSSENCWANATDQQTLSAGAPQYYVQYMGQRDSTDVLDLGSSASSGQYGGEGGVPLESFYRVFARSQDPSAAPDRAVVVLQSNIVVK